MERIPRAIYTKELREEAVKLVMEGGLRIPEVGRRLSVSPSTLRYWVKVNRDGKHGWGTYPRLSMSGSSTQGRLHRKRALRVHY
jgi:transposase